MVIRLLAASLLTLFSLSSQVAAKTWNVPSEISTIQTAIDTATSSDTVDVAPGTYHELLVIDSKSITLLGIAGPESTILSGATFPQDGFPILEVSKVDSSALVQGFTFRDADTGYQDGRGGAISCLDTCSVQIKGNVFKNNFARSGGAIGISPGPGSPRITHNFFQGNSAFIEGGAIAVVFSSEPIISQNVFVDNVAMGGGGNIGLGGAISFNAWLDPNPVVMITSNVIYRNEAGFGGAIRVWDGNPTIVGNTIVLNRSNTTEPSRAAGIDLVTQIPALLANNIVALNVNGWGIHVADQAPVLVCNDFWQNDLGNYYSVPPGVTDFSADPSFCSTFADDFTLADDSPCLLENSGGCGLVGALGFGCSEVVGVEPPAPALPALVLANPLPNPFSSTTRITYSLPDRQYVRLAIFDLQGRRIATMVDEDQGPGEYTVKWDGRIDTGLAASGVYFLRLRAGKATKTQTLMFVR